MAQEILSTFEAEIGEVALRPRQGRRLRNPRRRQAVWSRHERKRFPEIKGAEAGRSRRRRSGQKKKKGPSGQFGWTAEKKPTTFEFFEGRVMGAFIR